MISASKPHNLVAFAFAVVLLLLSACQPAPPTSSASPQAQPATAVPTPDELIKGTLRYGEGQLGNLAGEDEFWAFEGQEGDVVDISMVSASADMDPTFSLIGPSNKLLNTVYSESSSPINYEANLNCYELPESGRYVIVASTYHADMMAGSYILTVEKTSEDTAGEPSPLVVGEVAENLGCGRQSEAWLYEGNPGELIWLQVAASSDDSQPEFSGDFELAVEEAAGEANAAVELARYSNDSELDAIYLLTGSGDYQITVDSTQEQRSQSYTISLNFIYPSDYGYGYYEPSEMQVVPLTFPGFSVIPYDVEDRVSTTITVSVITPDYRPCDEIPVSLNVISPVGEIQTSTSDSEVVTQESLPAAVPGTTYFPMGEADTYRQYRLDGIHLDEVGRYLVALISLKQEPTWPDDCSYFAFSLVQDEQ